MEHGIGINAALGILPPVGSRMESFFRANKKIIREVARDVAALHVFNQRQPGSVFVLTFRPVLAQRIEELQQELQALTEERARIAEAEVPTLAHRDLAIEENKQRLDTKLHAYANALRDYQTLSEEAVVGNPARPPLLRTAVFFVFARDRYRRLMAETRQQDWTTERYNFRELNPEVRLARQRTRAFWERLWMGVFGGVALIGPMLLMVLHHDQNTSIIVASVATALFTLVLALAAQDWQGKDILGATAAYAAVLVVFVGTSSPGG